MPAQQSDGFGGALPGMAMFGDDYQAVASEGTSTTDLDSLQLKLSMTTPGLTGTYRVGWYFEATIDSPARSVIVEIDNSTDAVVLGAHSRQPGSAGNFTMSSGYQNVVFAGSPKTFRIRFRVNVTTASPIASIRRARLQIWRVA